MNSIIQGKKTNILKLLLIRYHSELIIIIKKIKKIENYTFVLYFFINKIQFIKNELQNDSFSYRTRSLNI